ncbi:hypothetical protein DB32_007504 [Sandaracinus amylolyticus]|uniref:Uncharacterized protein n=1 Tax=Sandaracinus amylolyticus TaxID=927083 RepID=A0A0F6W8V0_9BACT|nr:hypothetical protein DB32_007504 [Sandaracinus amylolyticus]
MELGDAIASTFRAVGQNLVPFLVISAIVVLPTVIVQTILEVLIYNVTQQSLASTRPEEALSMLGLLSLGYIGVLGLIMLMYAFGQGAIMYLTVESLVGRKASVGDAVRAVLGRIVPLVIASFLVAFVTGIGAMFCFAPGIIAWIWLSAALPACLVERLGPIQSMQRSIELTEGHRMTIFLIFLVLFGGFFGVTLCVAMPARLAGGMTPGAIPNPLDPLQLAAKLVMFVVQLGSTMVLSAAIAVVYAKLRGLRDGVDAQALARVFA